MFIGFRIRTPAPVFDKTNLSVPIRRTNFQAQLKAADTIEIRFGQNLKRHSNSYGEVTSLEENFLDMIPRDIHPYQRQEQAQVEGLNNMRTLLNSKKLITEFDPLVKDRHGYDALTHAVMRGQSQIVKFLLESGLPYDLNHAFNFLLGTGPDGVNASESVKYYGYYYIHTGDTETYRGEEFIGNPANLLKKRYGEIAQILAQSSQPYDVDHVLALARQVGIKRWFLY